MASMQHLDLCAHMVTDEGVPALAGLGNLEVLWLSRCGISDESVQVLAGMQSLRELNVSHTGVSAAALQRLREALPDCRLVEPD
jgi:pyridoxine 5'-phosphate synthase PdxJ